MKKKNRSNKKKSNEKSNKQKKRSKIINILLLIFIVIVVISQIYRHNVLNDDNKSTKVVGEVIKKYKREKWKHKRTRIYLSIDCKYYVSGNERISTYDLDEEEWRKVEVGDCVEIRASYGSNMSEWNDHIGFFNCPD